MKETIGMNARPSTLFIKHIFRKLFLEDWPIKLSALVITFALWYGVSYSNKKGTATMDADLAFRVADNATLTSVGAQHFSAKISGDDRKIDDLINRRAQIP